MLTFLLSVFKPLAYLSLPVFLLKTIASTSSTGRYYVRVVCYAGTMATVGLCSVVVAAGMAFAGQKYNVNYVVARTFHYVAGYLFDLKIEVEGEEYLETRPAVILCNHQSMLDIYVVGRMMPKQTSMTSKKSIQYTPIGPFMTMSGAIFIDRANPASAVRSLNAAGEIMKRHQTSIWIYPEGTRHAKEEPDMLPFKKGAFHLAVQSELPIIPVVTENYWNIYRKGYFGTGTIKVRVLPPVSTIGLKSENVTELVDNVRSQMLATLREISGQVPPPSNSQGNSQKPSGAAIVSDQVKPSSSAPTPVANQKPEVAAAPPPPLFGKQEQRLEGTSPGSRDSLESSEASSSRSGHHPESSENGVETEEDEGMVLVGRPKA